MIVQKVSRKLFSYLSFVIIFLGLLSAFAPFVTDMYLPTLPSLESEFATSVSMIQLGLTASMVGLAVGQVFFGPLSDKYGRRPILFISLILFCVATALCVYSPDIEFFLYMRLFQGLGASGGIVLSRSVATDMYSGRELGKMMAIIGAVNGVAPVTAPVIGGVVASFSGWQGIFVVLLCLGIVLLGMTTLFRESLPRASRDTGSVFAMFRNYRALFGSRRFMAYTAAFAMSQGVLFAYIAAAPFVVQHDFGFSEMQFSVVFGINALGIGLGSALSMKFRTMRRASLFGSAGMLAAALAMLAANIFAGTFWPYEICTWLMLFTMGYVFTGATTIAMDEGREYIGAAAATVGASGFMMGGIVSPLVGLGSSLISCPVICVVCGALSLAAVMLGRR